jgi:hypothetical protein
MLVEKSRSGGTIVIGLFPLSVIQIVAYRSQTTRAWMLESARHLDTRPPQIAASTCAHAKISPAAQTECSRKS